MKGRRSVPFLFLFLFISSLRRPRRKETLGVFASRGFWRSKHVLAPAHDDAVPDHGEKKNARRRGELDIAASQSPLDFNKLTVLQPGSNSAGAIQFSTLQVVNRDELGTFTQQWDVSDKREVRREALYGTAILDGTAHLDGYALVDVNPHASRTGAPELAIGWRARFAL